MKIKTTIPKRTKDNNNLVIETLKPSKPMINIKYFHQSNKCFKHLHSKRKNKKEFSDFCDLFQKFIFEFEECQEIGGAIKRYASNKNGKKVIKEYTKNLLNFLPNDVQAFAKHEVIHLHLKPNGNSRELVWGFTQSNIFYVIALDPDHEGI